MGELIVLAERLSDRSRSECREQPAFFFDLACPFSYLAAERVERILGDVEWVPTPSKLLDGHDWTQARACLEAERLAGSMRLPLVWPDGFPMPPRPALRAASYAAEIGAGARFALAASRLAFCGGFDLSDPEILTDAAAAVAIPLERALAAAGDPSRDHALDAIAQTLVARGVRRLPAIRIGERWFSGTHAVEEAASSQRARASAAR
jgi:2-hydroxychromene-2-carboxylate isomerase